MEILLESERIFDKHHFVYIVGGATPVGSGKTSLMYGIVRPYMVPPLATEFLGKMRKYVDGLKYKGFKNLTFPKDMQCPVYVVGDSFTSYDYDPIDPTTTNEWEFEKLRIPDENNRDDDERILPFAIVCIPDLANYVDSREHASSDPAQRRWLAYRRKIHIKVLADGQHYGGSDKRWRQMADCIIEILDFEHKKGDYYSLAVTKWKCLRFKGWKGYERYINGDKTAGEEVTYIHVGDIYGLDVGESENLNCCMDSYTGRELFLGGTSWNFTARVADPKKDDQKSMQARYERMRVKPKEDS